MAPGRCACLCGLLSRLLVCLFSLKYLAIGLTMTAAAFLYILVNFPLDFVPLYPIAAFSAGLLSVFLSCAGFCAMCQRRRRPCAITLALLTILPLGMLMSTFELARQTSGALLTAQQKNFCSLDPMETAVAESLQQTLEYLTTNCGAKVSPVAGSTDLYELTCTNKDDYSLLHDTVNGQCFKQPGVMTSVYLFCYSDTSWWAPSALVKADPFEKSVTTSKGLFCHCSDYFVDLYLHYLSILKWTALAFAVLYAGVVVSLCYLCTCEVLDDDENQKVKELLEPPISSRLTLQLRP